MALGALLLEPIPRQLATPSTAPLRAGDPTLASAADIALQLVRRVAWGSDGRKGTARLEIGAGALAGAVLRVDADGGEVSVDLELPPGVSGIQAGALEQRIEARLAARGLGVRSVTVH